MGYCIFCMAEIEQNAPVCPHCGKRQDAEIPAHHLLPGTLLQGRFMIGAALGEGGFGITYIGRDQQLDLRVAVKEYYPNGYANRSNTASPLVSIATAGERRDFFENGRDRFLREARMLARFSSEEGIVTVRDFFQENNTAYIVMEYLEGQTLKDYLKEHGTMTPEQTLDLMRPVMRSLREVHKQGLIHRDIAPDNIMIVGGKVKLLDFGAARNMSSIANKSLSVVLKPGYAPEEQYRSKGNQGPWTDVYALAATMYKCITGDAPDDATQRLYTDELKTPSEKGAAVSPGFEAAIMKGLAVLQQDRFQNIDEFLDALEGRSETELHIPAAPAPKRPVSEDAETGYIDTRSEPVTVVEPEREAPVAVVSDAHEAAKKPSKGRIIAIAAGAAVLLAGIILAIVLLGGKGKGKNKGGTSEKPLALSDNIYDTTFELDGVVYQLPMSFDKLTTNGWKISDSGLDDTSRVPGYKSESFAMRKKGASIEVSVYNTGGNSRMIKECVVFGVEGKLDSGSNIILAKGIDCESSVEEIIAAFGNPTQREDYDSFSILTYAKAKTSGVEFYCYTEESGFKSYSSITVENINFEDEAATETNSEVPDYLSKYKTPSALGSDLLSCRISIGGDLYQLPAPLSAFKDNGWQIKEKSVSVPSGDNTYITLERGGVWFYADIINLADYQTVADNCAVYRIAIGEDKNVPVEIAGGIVLGSTPKSEVEAKIDSNYYPYDGYDYYSYTYSDYSRGFDLQLSIEVSKNTEKVSHITLSNKEWNY